MIAWINAHPWFLPILAWVIALGIWVWAAWQNAKEMPPDEHGVFPGEGYGRRFSDQ